MKKVCECGRAVHLSVVTRGRGDGVVHPEGHDLCARCYRRVKTQAQAAQLRPKPFTDHRWYADQYAGVAHQQTSKGNPLEANAS